LNGVNQAFFMRHFAWSYELLHIFIADLMLLPGRVERIILWSSFGLLNRFVKIESLNQEQACFGASASVHMSQYRLSKKS
jgi:hypothetical protein